jgi:hypothetical protein
MKILKIQRLFGSVSRSLNKVYPKVELFDPVSHGLKKDFLLTNFTELKG